MSFFFLKATIQRIIKIQLLYSIYLLSYFTHYSLLVVFLIHFSKELYLVGWGYMTLEFMGKREME